jgi:hypothetical protein
MGKYDEMEGYEPKKGPHPDFKLNLFNAKSLCGRIQKDIPSGMRIYIVDILLWVSFTAGPTAKYGVFATPITLHQPSKDYDRITEKIVNYYFKYVKNFYNKQQLELSLKVESAHLVHGDVLDNLLLPNNEVFHDFGVAGGE